MPQMFIEKNRQKNVGREQAIAFLNSDKFLKKLPEQYDDDWNTLNEIMTYMFEYVMDFKSGETFEDALADTRKQLEKDLHAVLDDVESREPEDGSWAFGIASNLVGVDPTVESSLIEQPELASELYWAVARLDIANVLSEAGYEINIDKGEVFTVDAF